MRLKLLSCLFFLFAFASCQEEATSHLPAQKMEEILLDIHLAEAYSTMVPKDSTVRITDKNLDSLAVFYKKVFDNHQITQQQFLSSMKWYKEHPVELDSIYTRMIPRISEIEGKY